MPKWNKSDTKLSVKENRKFAKNNMALEKFQESTPSKLFVKTKNLYRFSNENSNSTWGRPILPLMVRVNGNSVMANLNFIAN